MTTKEIIEVIQAYEEGKQIQCRNKINSDLNWSVIIGIPIWNFAQYDYSIKPEESKNKLRSYANANEFVLALREHGPYIIFPFAHVEYNEEYCLPINISENGINFFDQNMDTYERTYFELCDKGWMWQDGTPCGIVMEN